MRRLRLTVGLAAIAGAIFLSFIGCFQRTTNPTIVENQISIVLNLAPGQTQPAAGGGGSSSLCGIPIQSVVVSGPASFVHGTAQKYTATPLDQAGTDITTECSTPAQTTFTVGGVFSGTSSSAGPNVVEVNPASAGSGTVGANIGGVQSAPFTAQVQ